MAFNGYVQVPPDSTGKKIGHVAILELDYSGGTVDFVVGNVVTGVSSGASGIVEKITGTTTTGEIYLALRPESPIAFTNGENLQVSSVTYAQASGVGSSWYNPIVTIVDHENPYNGVNVTNEGALVITPAGGSFGFDAFGGLSVSQQSYLGLYHFNYGVDWGQLMIETGSVGGTLPTGSNYPGIILSCPTTSGSISRIKSHLYHPYNAGTAQKWIGSIIVGDTGKTNVVRRWGMFDESDGLFFELSGSAIATVVRSSATGTVVDTKISQSAWNVDRADGSGGDTNISDAHLDVSKGAVYFFDFQWLGVGRVRFGMIWNGVPVVLHQVTNNANLTLPYMGKSNLPCRIEQINYGTAGSTSELRSFSMAVTAATPDATPVIDSNRGQTIEYTKTIDWTGSFRPLFSLRPKQTLLGKDNRSISIPKRLQLYSSAAPIVFQIQKWPVLTGDTWTAPANAYGALEGDTAATTASFGTPVMTDMVKTNDVHYHDFDTSWNRGFKIHRKADITDGSCPWTVMGKLLNDTIPSSSVTLLFDWNEIL